MRRNSLANANVFANEMAENSFSLRKFLANGRLWQNSLAIANAMAWCTQIPIDRQIPKPCRGFFEQVMTQCHTQTPPLNDPMPGIGDYIHILPKLLLHRGDNPKRTYAQKIKLISRLATVRSDSIARAMGSAMLWQHAINTPTPPFRRFGENDDAIGNGGLSRDTARSLDAATQKRRVGKVCRQLHTPPPMGITSEVWKPGKGLDLGVCGSLAAVDWKRKKNPKRKFSGRISRGRPGVICGHAPGQ